MTQHARTVLLVALWVSCVLLVQRPLQHGSHLGVAGTWHEVRRHVPPHTVQQSSHARPCFDD